MSVAGRFTGATRRRRADFDVERRGDKETPLSRSVSSENKRLVRLLLETTKDLNAVVLPPPPLLKVGGKRKKQSNPTFLTKPQKSCDSLDGVIMGSLT